ncbi:DUF6660 family protein [Pseudotenacibaculum sp. MALMAid0570]|uniref:DUF6660 family protein n=1 Tax=Pseudotenacibaculum sp. MALMAid0570 TaxID=3143938 RepID=UPI0032DF9BB6
MKSLAILLSLIMLFLSLNPCSDGQNFEDQFQDEISVNHNHQDDSNDTCPATCICSCCGMSITYLSIELYDLSYSEKISTKIVSLYQSNYRFDFHSSIWQPPQA